MGKIFWAPEGLDSRVALNSARPVLRAKAHLSDAQNGSLPFCLLVAFSLAKQRK